MPQVKAGNSKATTPLPLAPRRAHIPSVNVSFPFVPLRNVTGSHARSPSPGSLLSGDNPVALSRALTPRLCPVLLSVLLSNRRIVRVPLHDISRTPPEIARPFAPHGRLVKSPRTVVVPSLKRT